ncbi:C-type lectin domain family 4 member E [Megalops cyprinoides]|uniref:C-type lectin domain family 4 member E n=1 Tax=Megalops cyprinoides TaxID=118141 RepID=UPI001863EE7E|nr:C-type lectin domain family 4 member E [Megalops cyprinoides]
MYIKFCRTYDNGDDNTKWPDQSKKLQGTDLCRRVQVYRGLSVILSILALILAAAVIFLSVKLQTRAVCLEKETATQDVKVLPPQTCSAEKCRAMYPQEQTQVRACFACDPGWQQFEDSCFYLSREHRTWIGSREVCRQRAGDLAVIDNGRVQEFLTKKGNLMYWIGLSWDGTRGWVWVNNATVGESYWSNSREVGDCGFLTGREDHRSSWSQSPCTYNAAYICQKDAKQVAVA